MKFCVLIAVASMVATLGMLRGGLVAQTVTDAEYLREEMSRLPVPEWVRMRDQVGDDSKADQRLKGLRTPVGVTVEIVGQEPTVVDPVAMTFADDGSLLVLEWREATNQIDTTYDVHYQDGTTATVNRKTKNVNDQLKRLTDTNGDGVYETSQLLMDDLEMPSSILLHNDWMYFPSVGHVIRRRRTLDGSFEEQEILRGMCGYHHHQVSGLTVSHDNWMYTTSGDDDNIAEGSDGSRATVLRTGAIFRSRPNGSRLTEFARGFRNPYRNVVFDELYNMFHVDNDQEDGSKFQGVRLMHLLEGADYGWRLEMGAKCCRTDFSRGAVFGERPGKMPSMFKTGRGAPAGLLIYQGTRFPDEFRGLLIYPDVYRMKVRAYEIERAGSTFKVVSQFTLMESDDGMFRPVQALAGPDGAIYVLDWRTNSGGAGRSWGDGTHGRIYRLRWSGTDDEPAIALGQMNDWEQISRKSNEQLFDLLATTKDFEIRERSQKELVRRGSQHAKRCLEIARDSSLELPARAVAFGAACQLDWKTASRCAHDLLSDPDFEMRRLAAEAIGHQVTESEATLPAATILANMAGNDAHPAVKRAAALAAGAVGAATNNRALKKEIAKRLLSLLLTVDRKDVYLFDGILRGVERCGAPGVGEISLMATSDDSQQRELATELFLALRTHDAAAELDRLLAGDTKQFSEDQLVRLLNAYRHIVVRPPIEAIGVSDWLKRNPNSSTRLQITALETLGLVGGGKSPIVATLTVKLLTSPDAEIRQAAIDLAGELRVIGASRRLFEMLCESERALEERRQIIRSLALLKAEQWPYADRGDPGVELVLPDLIQQLKGWQDPQLIADSLWLLGQVDEGKADSVTESMLDVQEAVIVNAAIDVRGSDMSHAVEIGQRFVAGELPASTRPSVAAALQRHVGKDSKGMVDDLLKQIYRDGLSISLDPNSVAKIKQLVVETGDSRRGRDLFLNAEKSQCINCHRIEGVGGSIGPDLNKIWQTHTVEKIIESIVEPSLEIKEGFETWSVVTKTGNVYGGLKLSDGPPQVVLRGANGRDYRINIDEIEEKVNNKRSLMPDATVSQLSLTEFVDLVAFLKDANAQGELPEVALQSEAGE